jgi:hypothetical protein
MVKQALIRIVMSAQSNITSSSSLNDTMAYKTLIESMLTRIRTSLPVKVIAVTNNGAVSPIGYVDIQILVNQIDAAGNGHPHGIIHNVPYFRLQGGANAVIIDPEVGDIGLCSFCDRDISGVKQAKDLSIPLSNRKHDLSDAIYTGTIIGEAPTQYIQFNSSGITITSPNAVIINASNATINASSSLTVNSPASTFNGAVTITGAITAQSTITAAGEVIGNGKALSTHIHSGVTSGSSNTGTPV